MKGKAPEVTGEIAKFVASVRAEDLPPEAVDSAKRCILDGIGVIFAGHTEPCARIMRRYVQSVGGKEEATILGRGKFRAPAQLAALVNGTAGHAIDWDDTALSRTPDRAVLLHPTVAPLAAGLAVGELLGSSGRDFLTAFIVGVEVECKMAEAIHPDHWVRGFHTTNTLGIFGAAACAARLMNLSPGQVQHAFGATASMSSGVGVNHGTMGKAMHGGRAAENGIVAARLASLGFETHPESLEGARGFFQCFGGGFDPDRIFGRLGRPFSILDPGVSVKPYPCGVVGHPAMDAMKELVTRHDLRPEEVARIRVATGSNVLPPKGPLRYGKAANFLQAKFSVPFQMASMAVRRKAGLTEFTDAFVQSPIVQEMMDRVETLIDPEIDALGRDRIVSVIDLTLKDGPTLRGKSTEPYRGGPLNPLSREELMEKFRDCVQQALNTDQVSALAEAIESIDRPEPIASLVERAAIP